MITIKYDFENARRFDSLNWGYEWKRLEEEIGTISNDFTFLVDNPVAALIIEIESKKKHKDVQFILKGNDVCSSSDFYRPFAQAMRECDFERAKIKNGKYSEN